MSVVQRNALQQRPRVLHFLVEVDCDGLCGSHKTRITAIANGFGLRCVRNLGAGFTMPLLLLGPSPRRRRYGEQAGLNPRSTLAIPWPQARAANVNVALA